MMGGMMLGMDAMPGMDPADGRNDARHGSR